MIRVGVAAHQRLLGRHFGPAIPSGHRLFVQQELSMAELSSGGTGLLGILGSGRR